MIINLAILILLITAPTSALEIISLPIEKNEGEVYQIKAEIPIILGLEQKNIQDNYNKIFRDSIFEFIKDTVEMARSSQQDFAEAGFSSHEFIGKVDFSIKNVQEILSIKFNYYQYTGGAHGNPYSLSYNIDLETGAELELIDFLNRKNIALLEIEKIIRSEIENYPDKYFQADYGFQNLASDQHYYLEDNELVVYFQPYAIGPYSTGIPEFRIKY
jgi:hypothetical protein